MRLAALGAPRRWRERMASEWEAELAAEREDARGWTLARAALGAFADARALRKLARSRVERTGRVTMSEWTGGWIREGKVAVRSLLRTPTFTAVAVLTLALGLGGSAAIYTLLDRVVLDPLPYPEPERLVRIVNHVPGVGADTRWDASTAQYVYFGDHAETLEAVGVYVGSGANLQTPSGPERVRSAVVTAEVLPLLGGRARIGRLITPGADAPGAPAVAVLSHAFWSRAFGEDPDVVGRTLSPVWTDEPVEVVGVLEPGIELPGSAHGSGTDVWTPLRVDRAGSFGNSHFLPMIARLAPGADPASVEEELARLTTRLPEAFPDAYSQRFLDRYGFRSEATPLKQHVVGDMARNLWIVFGAVGLLLLIACANAANLFLVRMESRRRELAVRGALGATRGQLARYLLVEGLALAGAGGALGLLVGYWAVPALTAMAPDTLPRIHGVGMGWDTVAFTSLLALAVGLGLSLYPILVHSDPGAAATLAEAGRWGSEGRPRQRFRSALVVTQMALALVLAVGAGLLVETMRSLYAVDRGIDPEGLIALDLHLARERHGDDQALWAFYGELLERVRGLPGVAHAGMSQELPVEGGFGCVVQGFEDRTVYDRLEAAGMTTCAGQEPTTPGYFETMGIPLLRGRAFTDADNADPSGAAVVVSRAFAERFWPGEDPIGKGVAPNGRTVGPFHHVVGVVGDVPARSLEGEPAIAIYYPIVHDPATPGNWGWWYPGSLRLVVRTSRAEPLSLVPELRRIVGEMDPEAPLANAREMEAVIARSMSRLSFTSLLLGIAAGTSLLLAAVGLYGVVSWTVSRRTREIGVRIAIGARPREVELMILGRSLGLAALGLTVGVFGALAGTRLMEGLLYGVEPTDPGAFAGAALLLVAVTLLASWIPARRAARVDPSQALRGE